MRIVFATNNSHKLEEAASILGPGFELVTLASLGIDEDIPETADTLEGNALQKARYVYERMRAVATAIFADDTGLEVAALGGAPGVRSARYAEDAGMAGGAGRHDFDANNRLLLENMRGVTDRTARFRTVIALILATESGADEYLFEGEVRGRITEEYRGTGGFGYDPIFVPGRRAVGDRPPTVGQRPVEASREGDRADATFAEMSPLEKNAISHRARAMEKLSEFLESRKQPL